MAFHLHAIPDLFDLAVGTDQECAAHNSFERSPHEFLHPPQAVRLDHFVIGVAEQREIQFLTGLEFRERLFRVRADPNYRNTKRIEVLLCVTKLGRFCRSTGSVRFGKEKQDNTLALVGFQREFAALVRLQCKVWGFVAWFQHD